jgi:small subunit ribosomal protein S2
MQKIDSKALLESAAHFGHRTQKWCPKMKPYIHGARAGIHLFDLEKTAHKLELLLSYLTEAAASGKSILFVSTKPQTNDLIPELARATGNPYVSHRWICGTITNFSTVRSRINYLNELKSDAEHGGFEKYTKKEASKFRKEMTKLQQSLGGIASMKKLPDIVFVVDAKRDENAVKEARVKKIPVIGIADSNADPDMLDLFVPANDDAMKSLTFILNHVQEALLKGRGQQPQKTQAEAPHKDTNRQ